jgi:5-methylcytosine-specific restriction endonuclease McrA
MTRIDEVTFLRKLQRLLEEGDFVATYKFALLQALADLSVENDPAANGTLALPLSLVAEKFIDYYWRQARPYRNGLMLAQNHGRQAAILNRVALAHSAYQVSLTAARRDSSGWRQLVTTVAGTVEQMPLWKLQIIGGKPEEFLYRADTYCDRRIVLEPGVADCFRSFHPFIVNMVRGAWVDHLLRIRTNQKLVGEQGDLSEFLFGSERRPLDEYRAILRNHQATRCFYCDQRVAGNGALDHFIPWARYPVDLGHNFVFAHSSCNRHKRDYLAHPEHLARWREQNLDSAEDLGRQFDDAVLSHDVGRTRKIAVWAYQQAELAEAHVWIAADEVQGLTAGWRRALGITSHLETYV